MKAAARWSGRAPHMARSFTVPLTASRPMSPPGKKIGVTTKESVVKRQARSVEFNNRLVVEAREIRIAEGGKKNLLRSGRP